MSDPTSSAPVTSDTIPQGKAEGSNRIGPKLETSPESGQDVGILIGAGGPAGKAATGPEPCSRYAGDISLYQIISSVRGVHLILLLTP